MTTKELEEGLPILLDDLGGECMRQGSYYYEASQQAAIAKAAVAQAKLHMDKVRAELELHIRQDPEKFIPGVKVTENTISAFLNGHEVITQARAEIIKRTKEYDEAQALASAFEHKRSMIKMEVTIQTSQVLQNAPIRVSQREAWVQATEQEIEDALRDKNEQPET